MLSSLGHTTLPLPSYCQFYRTLHRSAGLRISLAAPDSFITFVVQRPMLVCPLAVTTIAKFIYESVVRIDTRSSSYRHWTS